MKIYSKYFFYFICTFISAQNKKIDSILMLFKEDKDGTNKVNHLDFVSFAGFIFRSLRITRKQKQIIEIKSREMKQQKKIIEEKNKDILDSIHYTKPIQQSLMPTEKFIERNLLRLNKN